MSDSSDQVDLGYWNDRANGYDRLGWVNNSQLLGWTAECVKQSIPPHIAKPDVLEIGAGTGALTSVLAPALSDLMGTYTASEPSSVMLGQLRDRVRHITTVERPWQDIHDEYDIVIARMVLRHHYNWRETLDAWTKLVRRGGMLVVVDGPPPSRSHLMTHWYSRTMTVKHGSPRPAIHAADISDRMMQNDMRTVVFETITDDNSLNNWLVGGNVSLLRANAVRDLHATASELIKHDYRMRFVDGDCLMRWRHCVVVGLVR
jgi:SAM-dependent methyltransferase